jgi:single-stranded-DNA-specific exonuclease
VIWRLRARPSDAAAKVADALGVPLKVGAMLAGRGLATAEAARRFLDTAMSSLPDPAAMPGLDRAAELLREAAAAGTPVAVCGDYDADGLTATALLKRVLEPLGLKVLTRIPHRLDEGYGLSPEAVREVAARGAGLLVTVDCGVSDREAAKEAARMGLRLIVTDHHELPPELPEAAALVNPHVGGGFAAAPLAGVGVAFMLAWAARKALGAGRPAGGLPPLVEQLALVALGTIADMAPLVGPNRVMVHHGLDFLAATRWPGLAALRRAAGADGQPRLTVRDVGFKLAPRLNAAGRLGSAEPALELLVTEDPRRAEELARTLDDLNRRRYDAQARLVEEALEILEAEVPSSSRTVVLARPGWPRGLLGLAASKVAERSGRPTVLFSVSDGVAVGSGRTAGSFNLFEALSKTRDLCLSMGGHSQAAGLRVGAAGLDGFRRAFEAAAVRQPRLEVEAELLVDLEASMAELDVLAKSFGALEPFGQGHPPPVAVLRDVRVLEPMPKGARLTLRVSDGLTRRSLSGFNLASRLEEVGPVMDLALAYEPDPQYGETWRLVDFRQPAPAGSGERPGFGKGPGFGEGPWSGPPDRGSAPGAGARPASQASGAGQPRPEAVSPPKPAGPPMPEIAIGDDEEPPF